MQFPIYFCRIMNFHLSSWLFSFHRVISCMFYSRYCWNVIIFLLQILYYFVSLFISNGLTKQVASYANLGTGVTILIGSLASIFIIDRKGRRPLLMFGISACLFSLLLFTLTLIIKQVTEINKLTILSIVLTYTFLFGFSVSLGKSVSKYFDFCIVFPCMVTVLLCILLLKKQLFNYCII